MLRITAMNNAEAAKEYYTAALARADYYITGSETIGAWRGRGAELLHLRNIAVDQKTFAALVDNLHPQRMEERLTARTRTDRR